ncbi:MAG: phytanoyl-CoA dioxygenase family protein, partial [Alphaproteobacteria bacterium]|nr:phytanoyl-CoA dioxygenase family protein [Alphaproteobacteria bacterium]
MLSPEQIQSYDDNGYILVEDAITPEQLSMLRTRTLELIDESRPVTESNDVFDLDEGHSASNPRLTRIKLPHKVDPMFWDVIRNSAMTEVLRDLLGDNVTLQTSKLNTKAPGGGM